MAKVANAEISETLIKSGLFVQIKIEMAKKIRNVTYPEWIPNPIVKILKSTHAPKNKYQNSQVTGLDVRL